MEKEMPWVASEDKMVVIARVKDQPTLYLLKVAEELEDYSLGAIVEAVSKAEAFRVQAEKQIREVGEKLKQVTEQLQNADNDKAVRLLVSLAEDTEDGQEAIARTLNLRNPEIDGLRISVGKKDCGDGLALDVVLESDGEPRGGFHGHEDSLLEAVSSIVEYLTLASAETPNQPMPTPPVNNNLH